LPKELAIKISKHGPICPACGEDRFDDYWRDPRVKSGYGIVTMKGALTCHGCGKNFHFETYNDGDTHSSMMRRVAALNGD